MGKALSICIRIVKEEKLTVAMTKADIVEALYEKVGFSKKEAADLVELVFDSLKTTLSKGQKIKISGFGNFVVREKRPRVGRNPQTGQSIEISARRVLTFRPSQVLRAEVNTHLEGKPIRADSVHDGDEDDDSDE
jgi:integration host factor subunit alpha